MSHTVTLQQRIQQLKKAQANLPEILYKTAKGATMRAVEAAMDATPPQKGTGSLKGTHTRTGALKQHWATDSIIEPMGGALSGGSSFTTFLKNSMEHASYVDQGHRMDRHFVPGLYIDKNGQLKYDPERDTGLVVGTKTKYVKGKFMVDKAREAYEKACLTELDKEIRKAFE